MASSPHSAGMNSVIAGRTLTLIHRSIWTKIRVAVSLCQASLETVSTCGDVHWLDESRIKHTAIRVVNEVSGCFCDQLTQYAVLVWRLTFRFLNLTHRRVSQSNHGLTF